MLHRFKPVLLIGCLMLPISAFSQNEGGFHPGNATYLWPTNASNYLSSTFAETRSKHFHAAIDLKTWGRNGYNVYATRDGVLHRIAIGPTGYGKVVYLKHDDGSYSLYAHLLRFEDHIQHIADSIRMKDYSFELDKTLDSLNIRVSQGDLIGLSGNSGIGPPHLHFELRTPSGKPFNPLLTNLKAKVKDTIPPRFVSLSVEPLSKFSKIENKHQLYTSRAQKRGNRYTFNTINTEGPIGLGVDVYDQADDVYNAYAVYELKMYVNDRLFFHSKVDSFAYNETNQMFIDRVYPILKKRRAGFQRLYIAEGNTLPFYRETGQSGKLDLPAGTHEVRIVAKDYYGNTSEASLGLRVHPSDTIATPLPNPPIAAASSGLSPENWNWFDDWVNIPKTELKGLIISPLGSGAATPRTSSGSQSVNIDLTETRDIFFRRTSRDHFIARRVYPDAFSIVPATTGDVFATFEPATVYDTLSIGITSHTYQTDSVQVHVFPDSQPIRKPFMLSLALDSTQMTLPNLAFYAYNKRRNKLEHLPTEQLGSRLVAYPESLGTFYALNDTIPPVLDNPRLAKRADGHWVVLVNTSDNLSGIDHRRSAFRVNNVRGIAEYEPEDNRLVYYHPDFTPRTTNLIEVTVYDKLGNERTETFILDAGG